MLFLVDECFSKKREIRESQICIYAKIDKKIEQEVRDLVGETLSVHDTSLLTLSS